MELVLATLVALIVGLATGLALALRARGERDRHLQNWKDALKDVDVEKRRTEELTGRLPALERELGAAREAHGVAERALAAAREATARLPALEQALGEARARAESLAAERAAFQRGEAERAQAHAAQLAQLADMQARLDRHFAEAAGKALGEAQTQFLKRAEERFQQHSEKSEGQLKALLSPVETTLKRYEENLAGVEKARAETYGELKTAVAMLAQGNDSVRRETQRLANVMRSSPKARGRWGEEQLKNILAGAGLAENVDFSLQSSVSDGERQLRPDCVIHLPGGRCIVVDVKCPLVHFEAAFDEEDEERRAALLLQHAGAMRAYANDLGRKGYWRQFDLSPDFVIMFIPGEHFLSAAAERAPELIEQAYNNGVIVASTINMLALAKVMAGMWRQEGLATQAREIAEAGKELYRRLATMGGHVSKLGRNLALANGAYNEMVGSLESQVLTQAKRFEALKVDTGGKAIESPPTVDIGVRPLVKLASNDGAG